MMVNNHPMPGTTCRPALPPGNDHARAALPVCGRHANRRQPPENKRQYFYQSSLLDNPRR